MRQRPIEMTFPIEGGEERYAQGEALMKIAVKMHQLGVRIDIGRARQHQVDAEARAEVYTERFLTATGMERCDLGPSGAGQTDTVRNWFWVKNGAPQLVFDKRSGEAQFNGPLLTAYAEDYANTAFGPAAAALLGLRKAKTAKKFAEAYEQIALRHNGRIHFSFNVFGTKGARWTSSAKFQWRDEAGNQVKYSVNAQNVPSKEPTFDFKDGLGPTKLAVTLRDCMIPDPGYVFTKWDYDGLELRLIEANSGSKKLAHWTREGGDHHMENAKALFLEAHKRVGSTPWKKYKDAAPGSVEASINLMREAAKPIAYGATYQYSNPERENKYPELYKQLKKLFPAAPETYFNVLIARFYQTHPEIVQMQQRIAQGIQRTNRIDLPLNAGFLYLPATNRGFNQAINAIHQSGGGALINRSLVNIDKDPDWQAGGGQILLQVHDELAGQIPEDKVDELAWLVADYMSEPAEFNGTEISIGASPDVGPNWADLKTMKRESGK